MFCGEYGRHGTTCAAKDGETFLLRRDKDRMLSESTNRNSLVDQYHALEIRHKRIKSAGGVVNRYIPGTQAQQHHQYLLKAVIWEFRNGHAWIPASHINITLLSLTPCLSVAVTEQIKRDYRCGRTFLSRKPCRHDTAKEISTLVGILLLKQMVTDHTGANGERMTRYRDYAALGRIVARSFAACLRALRNS